MLNSVGKARPNGGLKLSQLVDNLISSGKLKEAIEVLESINGKDNPEARLPVGLRLLECYINTKQPSKAENLVTELERYSDSPEFAKARVHIYYHQGCYKKAYEQSLRLTDKQRQEPELVALIPVLLFAIDITAYSIDIERDVLPLFHSNVVERRAVENIAEKLLIHKYQIGQSSSNVELVAMANDNLFLEYLKSGYSRSLLLEPVLIQIRHVLLTHSVAKMDLPDALSPLVLAIAWQNWHNEYVHPISSSEAELIDSLVELLMQQMVQPEFDLRQVEGLLLLVAMYQGVGAGGADKELKKCPIDSWPILLKDLAQKTLFEANQELEFAENIESLGSIEDTTSQRVKAQYEENPYPRWNHCTIPKVKFDYYQAMRLVLEQSDGLALPAGEGDIDLLIAGCGTGKQPLQQAISLNVNVTAIDITRRSLGYAAMMANKLGVDNVRFLQMDLMDVELLEQQYDVIECSGVLHHMEDPELGLRALLKVIKPGGIIRLGLYSEIARQSVIAVRKAFLGSGMQPDLTNIRAIRAALLSNDARPECLPVAYFGDFYATSPCRDLLFHAQEHQYTIPRILDMLSRYHLQFLGFSFDNKSIIRSFVKRFGVGFASDLSTWEIFEKENPDTFASMYQFFVRAPSEPYSD